MYGFPYESARCVPFDKPVLNAILAGLKSVMGREGLGKFRLGYSVHILSVAKSRGVDDRMGAQNARKSRTNPLAVCAMEHFEARRASAYEAVGWTICHPHRPQR